MRTIEIRTGALIICLISWLSAGIAAANDSLDTQLNQALVKAGFSGHIESTLLARLGRPLNGPLADLGRLLWFDMIGGLHSDNTCGGCHSPGNGFGDTQSIAFGIQNKNFVGRRRTGPGNRRRTPMVTNPPFSPPSCGMGGSSLRAA